MKRTLLAALLVMPVIFGSTAVSATLLFQEDFDGDLSAWTGKYYGSHNGEIVVDPLDPTNQVLHFTKTASGGDMFTIGAFTSQIDLFRLDFDYLGDPGQGGYPGDLGGFVGFTTVEPGAGTEKNGTMSWLAGTMDNYPLPRMELPDSGQWVHVEILFESTDPVHLILEDFMRSNGGQAIAGDVYFDNFILENPHPAISEDPPSPAPEPATLFLLGSGLFGLAGLRKWINKK